MAISNPDLIDQPLRAVEEDSVPNADCFWSSTKSAIDKFQANDFLKFFTMENALSLPLKKRFGFLHVVEDILGVFDEYHVRPFLDLLSGFTVSVLRSCAFSLSHRSDNKSIQLENHPAASMPVCECDKEAVSQSSSVKKLKDLRSLSLKVVSLILNKYDDHDFGLAFWDEFFASVKPLIDGLKEENLVLDVFSILSMKTALEAVLTCVLKLIENLLILDIELQNANNNVRKVILSNLEMAVFVSSRDALQPGWLLLYLRSVAPSLIKEKQKYLAKYSRHFLYSSPAQSLGPEDLTWRMIAGKLVNIRLQIRRSQRVVPESRSLCTCDCRHANFSGPHPISW
ncbi:hypothetical protein Ancab_007155 [Ancistrocladus abbreviatus]